MKNANFIKSALIIGSLVVASSAFADTLSTINSAGITTGAVSHVDSSTLTDVSSKSQLNAFTGVPTAAVSQVELNAVSGDGNVVWDTIKKIWRKATGMKNGSCKFPC